ncbi:MAG: tripartite tricarboxylate transporter substrate binding protein [Burkholderiales bacterium]
MKISTRSLAAGLLSASFLSAVPVYAQSFPTRPMRVIVPYAPGGSTDVVMRIIAPRMSDILGQQVVVENRPGGSSTIGLDIAAKSPPDGYTMGVANLTFGANPSLFKKMPFDSEKDLAPVSLVSIVTLVLTVHPSVPARSVKELIALAKSKPGSLNYGSAGNVSANHLATERFNHMTGTKMVHIPYKGGGPAVISIVSGETAILMATIPSSIQHFQSGRLIPLGVTTLKRNAALPDVPSINEAGVPGYESIEWNGVMVPAGTPPAVIARLNQAIVKSLAIPEVKERILGLGADPVGSTPEEFATFIKKEMATWSKVIKEVGITIE